MKVEGTDNQLEVGENVTVSGSITGHNNTVTIGNARSPSTLKLFIHGDHNTIAIEDFYQIKDLSVNCGNHVPANGTALSIGGRFSIEPGGAFLLYNSNNSLVIGSDCLFSNGITIRCGESPHLLFDNETGAYLDIADGVAIGDHVWVGERVYITKRARVAADCIVAACSVVTKRFDDPGSVLGGNPARVVRRNVRWVRNKDFLEPGSKFEASFKDVQSRLAAENAAK